MVSPPPSRVKVTFSNLCGTKTTIFSVILTFERFAVVDVWPIPYFPFHLMFKKKIITVSAYF